MSGIDLIKQLHRVKPGLPTLAVSMHPAAQFARRARLEAPFPSFSGKDVR